MELASAMSLLESGEQRYLKATYPAKPTNQPKFFFFKSTTNANTNTLSR